MPEDVDSETEDDESRSSSSGKISPSSSVSRHLNALGRECSSAEHHKPITSNTVTPIRAGYAVKQGAVVSSCISQILFTCL